MAKIKKKCRICGNEYEYCHTFNHSNKFRWQDVACSPECGNTYFERILASRSEDNNLHNKSDVNNHKNIENNVDNNLEESEPLDDYDDLEDDDFFDEFYDDEEDED